MKVLEQTIEALERERDRLQGLVERDAADKAIQRIGMALGSSDEWSDQETMIADVVARAEAAEAQLTASRAEIGRLREALEAISASSLHYTDSAASVNARLAKFARAVLTAIDDAREKTNPPASADPSRTDER